MPLVFGPHPPGWEDALEVVREGARPECRGVSPGATAPPVGFPPPTAVLGPLPVRICSAARLRSPAGCTARWRYILLDEASVVGTADVVRTADGPTRLIETVIGSTWESVLTHAEALLEARVRHYTARVIELPELRLSACHLAATRRANDLFLAVGAVFWPFMPGQWYGPEAFRLRVAHVAKTDRSARRATKALPSAYLTNSTQPA